MNTAPSDDDLRGHVVLITGATQGLGKAYALELAGLGARVLVNGRGRDAVEQTVDEIQSTGGEAAACPGDSRNGAELVRLAVAHYGRIDALIANAGVVRDRSFARMTQEEWDEVIDSHLGGSFSIVKAVWPVMAAQQSGRIVLTSSAAGMHGNFGQANYAAAKAGLMGLTKTLAIEGHKVGIRVNALAPVGLTQMNAKVLPPEFHGQLTAAKVAPYAAALCHPLMRDSGLVIEAGGGWAAAVRWQRARGLHLDQAALSTEAVLKRWADLRDFDTGSDCPQSINDSLDAAVMGSERRQQ